MPHPRIAPGQNITFQTRVPDRTKLIVRSHALFGSTPGNLPESLLPSNGYEFRICGLSPLTESSVTALEEFGVPFACRLWADSRIHNCFDLDFSNSAKLWDSDEIADCAMELAAIDTDDGWTSTAPAGLSDKILDAFYVAYSIGEGDIAASLRKILADYVHHLPDHPSSVGNDKGAPLRRAALWTAVIKSREEYRRIQRSSAPDRSALDAALRETENAYRRWARG